MCCVCSTVFSDSVDSLSKQTVCLSLSCQLLFVHVVVVVKMADFLSVPLKKSTDVDIVKPLKSLIQSTYNTEEYSDALAELSRLRTNAIWKVFEKSSLDVLYR